MKEQEVNTYFYNKHLTEEAIALFADALVLHKEEMLPSLLLVHVEECTECKKEIFGVYEIMRHDDEFKNIKSHPFFGNVGKKEEETLYFKKRYLIQIAAILLLLIGFGSIIFFIISQGKLPYYSKQQSLLLDTLKQKSLKIDSLNKEGRVEKKNTNKSVKKVGLALNMEKSDFFESLIASQYRSGDIEIVTPYKDQQYIFQAKIKFEFKGYISNTLTLIIYNNKEKKIFEKASISSKYYILEAQLPKGLFYWKLLKNDDLVYVGKFIVK